MTSQLDFSILKLNIFSLFFAFFGEKKEEIPFPVKSKAFQMQHDDDPGVNPIKGNLVLKV